MSKNRCILFDGTSGAVVLLQVVTPLPQYVLGGPFVLIGFECRDWLVHRFLRETETFPAVFFGDLAVISK